MIRVAIAGGLVAWLVSALSGEPTPEWYEVQVTTYTGDLFIAGAGSDCRSAWEHARVPRGWREIECVQVR